MPKNAEDIEDLCTFTSDQITQIRKDLISWFDVEHRKLPWRSVNYHKTNKPSQLHAYQVWTSEIMLQQTRVDTVIEYFQQWMKKFPTLEDLANASLDEVNKVWAGLGYYRRASHFHKAAKQLIETQKEIPQSVDELLKLPGIGRYTAGAISSIAFNQRAPVVDGNVIRVLSRLLAIDAEATSTRAQKHFWKIAEELVDPERPGDFNQSVMELGALICKPKNPNCSKCPLQKECRAFQLLKKQKIDSVEIYPKKKPKKEPRLETIACCIVRDQKKRILMKQRPKDGLLANLWEFPNVIVKQDASMNESMKAIRDFLNENFKLKCDELQECGQVAHIFSHIKQTILVFKTEVVNEEEVETEKWIKEEDVEGIGISTQMKKVFEKYKKTKNKKRKRVVKNETKKTKQAKLDLFFKR